jgi:hypothetical protein
MAKQAKTSTSLAHRTVRWCTGHCPVPQAGSAVNRPLSGIGEATWLKNTGLSGGAPDCPVRLQRPRPSTSATNSSLSGIEESVVAKNHRTVRWCTGLSGESEPPEPTVTSAISGWHVARTNGWLGTPDCVRCANRSEAQRSTGPDMEGDRAPDCYSSCQVVHRTVRCTARQKARITFQVDLQRLPTALGL